jgi:hypothetical protein
MRWLRDVAVLMVLLAGVGLVIQRQEAWGQSWRGVVLLACAGYLALLRYWNPRVLPAWLYALAGLAVLGLLAELYVFGGLEWP